MQSGNQMQFASLRSDFHIHTKYLGCANLDSPNYSDAYVEEYFEYLSILAEEGATFAVGSDAHRIERLAAIEAAWKMADRLGLTEDRIWRPACEPMIGGK